MVSHPSASNADHNELNTWLWCSRCCRCYRVNDIQLVPYPLSNKMTLQVCYYYPDCHAETHLSAWSWSEVRKSHPDYPKQPKVGVVYAAHLDR